LTLITDSQLVGYVTGKCEIDWIFEQKKAGNSFPAFVIMLKTGRKFTF